MHPPASPGLLRPRATRPGTRPRRHPARLQGALAGSATPSSACALMLDDQGKAQGRADYRRNLNTYAQCRASGVWPGYSQSIEIVNLPKWAITE